MPEARTLAFVASPGTVDRLPADSQIVPLSPRVRTPLGRALAKKPEGLLGPEDFADIESQVGRQSDELGRQLRNGTIRWQGVDLGECFLRDLELGLRDSLKASRVLANAMERVRPTSLVTDAAPLQGAFPPYPYLSGLANLIQGRASQDGIEFHSLALPESPPSTATSSLLAKAYLSIAARRALHRLREGHALLALGPYPGFYLPIARAARAGTQGPVVAVTGARLPIRADSRSGLSVLILESFLYAKDRPAVRALVAASHGLGKDAAHHVSEADQDAGVGPLLAAHLDSRFDGELPALAATGLAFQRGLERARAALAMETESPLARAFVRYAREAGIPVTVLQHGILAGAFSYRRTDADRIAAWGPTDAGWFASEAPNRPRTEATGSPKYDELQKMDRSPIQADAPAGRHLVLYASQPFVQDRPSASPWDRADSLRIALDAAAQAEGMFLLVKWHPSEGEEALPPETNGYAKATRGGKAIDLIRGARAVLAVSSTVAFEAMLLDRPVVFLGPMDPSSPFHPPEDGAGRRALDAAELARCLKEVVPDGAARERVLLGQREFLERHYTRTDGQAARRVLRLATGG